MVYDESTGAAVKSGAESTDDLIAGNVPKTPLSSRSGVFGGLLRRLLPFSFALLFAQRWSKKYRIEY